MIDLSVEFYSVYDGKFYGYEEDEVGLGLMNSIRLGFEFVMLVLVLVGDDGCWCVYVGDLGFLLD